MERIVANSNASLPTIPLIPRLIALSSVHKNFAIATLIAKFSLNHVVVAFLLNCCNI